MTSTASSEVRRGLAVLSGTLVLTALVAINLLQRMTPALAEFTQQHASDLSPTQEMLASLVWAQRPDAAHMRPRERFGGALREVRQHVEDPAMAALLVDLEEVAPRALDGDMHATDRALASLRAIDQQSRAALNDASRNASRLAAAGAWAMAFLGVCGFAAAALVRRRLERRVVAPLSEMERVLSDADTGDALQRCTLTGHPGNHQRALANLNRLLDRAMRPPDGEAVSRPLPSDLLPALLDAQGGTLALLDSQGELIAASSSAIELLSSQDASALRDGMRRVAQGMGDEYVAVVALGQAWRLVSLKERATPRDHGTDMS